MRRGCEFTDIARRRLQPEEIAVHVAAAGVTR